MTMKAEVAPFRPFPYTGLHCSPSSGPRLELAGITLAPSSWIGLHELILGWGQGMILLVQPSGLCRKVRYLSTAFSLVLFC